MMRCSELDATSSLTQPTTMTENFSSAVMAVNVFQVPSFASTTLSTSTSKSIIVILHDKTTKMFQSPKKAQGICERVGASSLLADDGHSLYDDDEVAAGTYVAEYKKQVWFWF
jgi:hypothetical protein